MSFILIEVVPWSVGLPQLSMVFIFWFQAVKTLKKV